MPRPVEISFRSTRRARAGGGEKFPRMCVADGRATFFSRPALLGVLAGAAAPLLGGAMGLEEVAAVADTPGVVLSEPHAPLTRGNAAAATLARRSSLVAATYAGVEALASSIR